MPLSGSWITVPRHSKRGVPSCGKHDAQQICVSDQCVHQSAGGYATPLVARVQIPPYLACPTRPKISQHRGLALDPSKRPSSMSRGCIGIKEFVVELDAKQLLPGKWLSLRVQSSPRSDDAGNQTRGVRAVRGTAMTPRAPLHDFTSDPTPSLFQVAGSGSQFGNFPST